MSANKRKKTLLDESVLAMAQAFFDFYEGNCEKIGKEYTYGIHQSPRFIKEGSKVIKTLKIHCNISFRVEEI